MPAITDCIHGYLTSSDSISFSAPELSFSILAILCATRLASSCAFSSFFWAAFRACTQG
jgi:hypothetical protein|eukprot:COSAG06_NODE_8247_length_2224_cov_1.488941_4_plen_59_part_00